MHIIILFLLFPLVLCGNTLNTMFAQRYYQPVGVIGQTPRGCYQATITHAADAMPSPRTIYLPDSEDATFSFLLYPFPGENILTFQNGSTRDVLKIYGRELPRKPLKVRLAWVGNNQDYDLHVNDVGYHNPEDDNGVLDHDWKRDGDEGEPVETITFTETPADLYNIYVTYFNDHQSSSGSAGSGAVLTSVQVNWDGKTVFNKKKLLRTVKSIWPIATLIVHANKEIGGCAVQRDGLQSPGIIPYPTSQTTTKDFGVYYDLSPQYKVTAFEGPNGLSPVYLRLGEAAQFNAWGSLNVNTPEQIDNVKLYGLFRENGAGSIDELGVYCATSTGKVSVTHNVHNSNEDEPSKINVYVIEPDLWILADHDRDGIIDSEDKSCAADGKPLRMWMNNDSSEGVSDIIEDAESHLSQGEGAGDCRDGVVNGRADLLDFFPVKFKLAEVLNVLPKEDFYYRLSHEENALNIVWTNLRQSASFYTQDEDSDGEGFAGASFNDFPCSASITPITANGVNIPEVVLDEYKKGERYAFLEGRCTTNKPLKLQIIPKNSPNTVAYTFNFRVSVSDVNSMFRTLNLRELKDATIQAKSSLAIPANFPDVETNGKSVFFIHGYNVSEENAKGWSINIFKKLYRAGSRAAFTAVYWNGDDSRIVATDVTPNYYLNVIHAFETAPVLKAYLAQWSGEKILLAHSLGNMLASSLLVDHNGAIDLNITHYAMLNAAIPSEAFGENNVVDNMIPSEWNNFLPRTYASNWHQLFINNADGRSQLTWRNRFATLSQSTTKVYNFYSSTEDVLTLAPETRDPGMRSHAWVYQEYKKGTFLQYFLPGETACEGGWGKNRGVYDFHSTEYLNNLSDEELVADPVFTPFTSNLHASTNTVVAIEEGVRNRILADGIPALSHAIGAISSTKFTSIDLNTYKNNFSSSNDGITWPEVSKSRLETPIWGHSTIRRLAYPFVYEVFEKIIQVANLSLNQRES